MSTPFPTSLLTMIRRSRLILNENKASTESLFTRFRQVTSLSGGTADRWEGIIEMVPLRNTELRTMWAFLVTVGLYGEWTIGDPDYTGPASGQTNALVNGAGQLGTSLGVDGLTPSVLFLRAGEYFQLGTGFHVMTTNVTASPGGAATLQFKPAMRVSPADNTPLVLTNPQMLVRLTVPPERETDDLKFAVFALPFEESL